MKKILFWASAVILAALTSCTEEYNTYNEYHFHGGTSKAVLIQVSDTDWEYVEGEKKMNCYFRATVDMPEITPDVLKNGLVKMYRVFDFEMSSETQAEMPYTIHNEYKDDAGNRCFYTETLDYEFSNGQLCIFYTQSDFMYEFDLTINPAAMDFRCVIL